MTDDDLIRHGGYAAAKRQALPAIPTGGSGVIRALPAPDVAALVNLLDEARSDLGVYVGAEYPPELRDKYPSVHRQYERDMELCRRIDAALAAWEGRK